MNLESKLKNELNAEQYEAATHTNGPAVIMAGAGSGKTHTLISRISYLVDNWVVPERILLLTFTNTAADEMRERAAKLYDDSCKKVVACTYHKFCNLMLRQYGKYINIKNYNILTPIENKNLIDYVKSSDIRYRDLKDFPSSKTLMAIYSKAINCQWTIEDTIQKNDKWINYIDYVNEITELYDEIVKYCNIVQKYNFDDLLIYMNKLLDEDDLCEKIATKFDFIMVDEFQDTNNLQEDILLKLSKYNKNIMVVGDISQSIYAFRGANVRHLQHFANNFETCKTIILNTNYRSSQQILDFANEIMNNNVSSWTYYNMKSYNNKQGVLPQIARPIDMFEQSDNVLSLIKHFHDTGIPYNDMAIIERGSMSSFNLESELAKLNIPYEKRGGMKFMDYDCIGDMLAYLTIIAKPYDILSWFRVLKLHPYIGNVTAKKIADTCKIPGFLTDDKYKSRKFCNELDKLDTYYTYFKNENDFHKVFDKIIEFYFDVRQRAINNSKIKNDARLEAQEALERDQLIVDQLKNMSIKYNTIIAFLDDLALDSISEDKLDDDKLIITTIHSAKGLEWKIVFIIDCVNGLLPSHIDRVTQYNTEEDEEELRCFYVAITRAKDYLYLFAPKIKIIAGTTERAIPTHYLTTKPLVNCN